MPRKKKIRPPIKIHGGKYYLANWIIEYFPPGYQDMTYVEPYCGGCSVFLNKEPCQQECINDIDLGIIQIYRALRDEPGELISRLKRVPYTERTFRRAVTRSSKPFDDYLSHAINEFILRRMSRGGLQKHFAWSTRKRGGQPGDKNAWNTILDELPKISEKLKSAFILNKPGVEVIKAFNDKNTLAYLDPPYLPDTRITKQVYKAEMTTDDHINLAKALKTYKGKAIISGYPSKLYKRLYSEWTCKRKRIANHASQQKVKPYKTECIWLNF
jgi:DNA adenine methylase